VPARGPTDFGQLAYQQRSREQMLTYLGWDPIFEYEGKTYAEMDKVEKNKISHRFKALEKLKQWLSSYT